MVVLLEQPKRVLPSWQSSLEAMPLTLVIRLAMATLAIALMAIAAATATVTSCARSVKL